MGNPDARNNIHAGGRSEHARADVGDVGQFEQTLNRAVFAERPVQHGEDDIHVDGSIGGAPQIRIGLKGRESSFAPGRFRRNDHRLAASQHSRSRGSLGIARPKLCGLCGADTLVRLLFIITLQQTFGVLTTSYFVLSIALRTDAADSNETSCSPLRPPKRMPTRSFAMPFQSGSARVIRQSQLWFRSRQNPRNRQNQRSRVAKNLPVPGRGCG